MTESRKKAYPHIFNGSNMKINPGDRGGDIDKSYRYGCLMMREDLLDYKERKNLSQRDLQNITGKNRSTVQGWLGSGQKSKNISISKYDFWKLVKACEPTDQFEWFTGMVNNLDDATPSDIRLIVRQYT